MQCVICIEGPFLNICIFISMICLIYQNGKEEGFCRKIRSSGEERITHVCVFVCVGGRVCANYILWSTSTHEKGLDPLLPQNNITEQCESLCKHEIIFENPPEPTLGQQNTC